MPIHAKQNIGVLRLITYAYDSNSLNVEHRNTGCLKMTIRGLSCYYQCLLMQEKYIFKIGSLRNNYL